MGNEVRITLSLDGDEAVVKGIERIESSSEKTKKSLSGWKSTVADFAHVGQSILLVKGAFDSVIGSVSGVASAIIEAQQTTQRLRNSLEYSAGSAAGAAAEMVYLRDISRTLGLEINSASAAYSKFAASTKGSGISADQTKTVFEGLAAASARMRLSADETSGALLALSQMASKGVVSAEELRGQLAERLPGALNIAAKSMGVTTAELGKMLETGQIMASDFLPKFGAALKAEFEAPLNSLTQEINRFSSAWSVWKQALSEGTNGSGFAWLTNGINESAAAMRALGNEAGVTAKLLVAIGGFEFGAVGAGKFDTTQIQSQKMAELKKVKAEILALQGAEERGEIRLSKTSRNRLDVLRDEEKTIRTTLIELAVRRGKETGFKAPDLRGDLDAQKAKQDQGVKAYLDDLSSAPKAVKLAAAIDKENKAFQVAVVGLADTDARYLKALKAHKDRVTEINAKAADKKTDTTKSDAAQENAQAAARYASARAEAGQLAAIARQGIEQQQIDNEVGYRSGLKTEAEYFAEKLDLQLKSNAAEQAAVQLDIAAKNAQLAKAGQTTAARETERAALTALATKAIELNTKAVALNGAEQVRQAEAVGKFAARVVSLDEETHALQLQTQQLFAQGVVIDSVATLLAREASARYDVALGSAAQARAAALTSEASALEIARIDATITQLTRLKDAADKVSRASAGKDVAQAGLDQAKRLLGDTATDPFKAWGNTLRETFATAGDGLARMVDALAALSAASRDYGKEMATINALRTQGGDDNLATAAKNEQALIAKTENAQLSAYASMAGAAKTYFKEGSQGYTAMAATEKALRTYQLIMSAKVMAQDLLAIGTKVSAWLMGDVAITTSAATSAAVQIPLNAAIGASSAAAGVANQAQGDPYTAFPRMAAMAALMAGLGLLVGGMSGGGSSSTSYDSVAAMESNGGTGTVLGDTAAQSESIKNSLSALESMAKPELAYTSHMVRLLTNIDASLSGTTNALLSSGFDAMGSTFEAFSSQKNNINIPLIGGLFGSSSKSTSLQDLGLLFAKQSIAEAMDGVELQKYLVTRTDKKSTGFLGMGGSSSTSYGTALSGVDSAVSVAMRRTVQQMVAAVTAAGEQMGASPAQLAAITRMDSGLGKVSLKGKTGDEITATLSAVFSKMGDQMAQVVAPQLGVFVRASEGMLETLLRVSSGIEEATYYTDRLNIAQVALSSIQNKQGDVAAELVRQSITAQESLSGVGKIIDNFNGTASDIADLYTSLVDVRIALVAMGISAGAVSSDLLRGAGGIDALASSLSDFQSGFLSESEQLVVKQAAMDAEFAKLGLATPSTAAAFKALVLGLDGSDAASQTLLGRVLSLSGGMKDLVDASESLGTAIASLFASLNSAIGTQLKASTSGRETITGGPAQRTYAQILAAIEKTGSAAPSTAALTAAMAAKALAIPLANSAQTAFARANSAAASSKTNLDNVNGIAAFRTTRDTNAIASAKASLVSMFNSHADIRRLTDGNVNSLLNGSIAPGTWVKAKFGAFGGSQAQTDDLSGRLSALISANSKLATDNAKSALEVAAAQAKYAVALAASTAAQTRSAAADAAVNKANTALSAAQDKYSASVTAWVSASTLSSDALGKLKDETLAYYAQQKALADLLHTSATGLRTAVTAAQLQTLSAAQSLQAGLADFAKNYSLAKATTGETKAGYADKMAAALPKLAQDLAATSATRGDWALAVAKLATKARTIATQLDAAAPASYETQSLTLLDAIDAKLGTMKTTAETLQGSITAAVDAGAAKTAAGLANLIKAVQGDKSAALQHFARGGVFTNGIVSRPTTFSFGEMGEAGPESIMPLADGPDGLGVRLYGGNGNSTARLEALIETQANMLDAMRYELRAIAAASNKTAKILERVTPDGSSLQTSVAI